MLDQWAAEGPAWLLRGVRNRRRVKVPDSVQRSDSVDRNEPWRAAERSGLMPEPSKELINDVYEQALTSLTALAGPLPGESLQPLQTWKAQHVLVIGPPGMGIPAQSDLKYKNLGLRSRGGKTEVMIHLKGTLRGQRDVGAVAGDVTGLLALSPETGQVNEGSVTFKVDLDLTVNKERVKANGQLCVGLKRGVPAKK
jgi:hypothetical protein